MDPGAGSIPGVNQETLGHYKADHCSSEGVPAHGRRVEWDELQGPSQPIL